MRLVVCTDVEYGSLRESGSGGEVSSHLGVPPSVAQSTPPGWQLAVVSRGRDRQTVQQAWSTELAQDYHWTCPEGNTPFGFAHIVQQRGSEHINLCATAYL
jgi:hypothetical protein